MQTTSTISTTSVSPSDTSNTGNNKYNLLVNTLICCRRLKIHKLATTNYPLD